jgi:hypothetical protein
MKPGRLGRSGIRVVAFATILAAMLLIAAAPGAMAADAVLCEKNRVCDANSGFIHSIYKMARARGFR